jgi:uncharacterized surface protein with fasciclin (FAS1) repeats
MNRLMLGAAAIALSVGTMGAVQAQTPTTGQQNLQPASCTQLDVGEVANRVEKLQTGTQKEQLEQLVQRAREASSAGNVMQCRELLVQAESKLPGGAQVTRETPMPGFLGGEGGQSSTARSASPEQAPIQADNLVAALRNNSQFSTLASLIETAGMTDTLSGSGSYTLFAPTNAAFDKLPQNVRAQLGQEQHRDHLRAILAQHVVEGHSLASTQLPTDIKAMGGDPIDVSLTNGRPRLNIGEPQPQTQPQTRTAESTAATPAPAPTPSATNQDLTDALSALENANQALAGQGQDNQAARDQLARARQAIDRGQLQTSERQPLQQASTAIDRATQALQNNDRAAARTAVNEALPPLRQAEAATPSSANQTNRRTAAQDTTRDTTRRSTDHTPASITVGDIRTGNGYVHGIDTVLIPESVQEALVR